MHKKKNKYLLSVFFTSGIVKYNELRSLWTYVFILWQKQENFSKIRQSQHMQPLKNDMELRSMKIRLLITMCLLPLLILSAQAVRRKPLNTSHQAITAQSINSTTQQTNLRQMLNISGNNKLRWKLWKNTSLPKWKLLNSTMRTL